VDNTRLLIGGIILVIIAGIGFVFPIPNTGYSIHQVHDLCESGIDQAEQIFGQLFGNWDITRICMEYRYAAYAIYGMSLVGIIMIIVGATVSRGISILK
jgi:hypothetical protein